jgi:hypothetical protein
MAAASTVNKLLHNVREPARSASIVPTLANNSLISTSKFVDAGYPVVYDKTRSTIMRKPPPRSLCRRMQCYEDGDVHTKNCGMSHSSPMFGT